MKLQTLLTAEDRLVFLQSLPIIHTSHQYLENLHWFEAVFKIFARAIEVKGQSMLNFEAVTSKFCNHFWNCGCQPCKNEADPVWQAVLKFCFFVFFYCSSTQWLPLVSNAKKGNLKGHLSKKGCKYSAFCITTIFVSRWQWASKCPQAVSKYVFVDLTYLIFVYII